MDQLVVMEPFHFDFFVTQAFLDVLELERPAGAHPDLHSRHTRPASGVGPRLGIEPYSQPIESERLPVAYFPSLTSEKVLCSVLS